VRRHACISFPSRKYNRLFISELFNVFNATGRINPSLEFPNPATPFIPHILTATPQPLHHPLSTTLLIRRSTTFSPSPCMRSVHIYSTSNLRTKFHFSAFDIRPQKDLRPKTKQPQATLLPKKRQTCMVCS
jgi:hypothetical protein